VQKSGQSGGVETVARQEGSMNFDAAMVAGMVQGGAIRVTYTFFLWLSWLVALAPVVVVVGEEWLLRSRASRPPPGTASPFT
jgi:hypothetical protein